MKPLEEYHIVWLIKHKQSELWLRRALRNGFDIHHIDGNHSNNDPDNLILIYSGDHSWLHSGSVKAFKGRMDGKWMTGEEIELLKASKGKRAYELRLQKITWDDIRLIHKITNPLALAKHYCKTNSIEWPLNVKIKRKTRKKDHRKRLNKGIHGNSRIQADHNLYGKSEFIYSIIKEFDTRDKAFQAEYDLMLKILRENPDRLYNIQIELCKGNDAQTFKLWHPSWGYTTWTGVGSFCAEYGLSRNSIRKIISGKGICHKGWRRNENDDINPLDDGINAENISRMRIFTLKSPDGDIIECTGLRPTCKKLGLCKKSLAKLLNGAYKHHKHYTLIKITK